MSAPAMLRALAPEPGASIESRAIEVSGVHKAYGPAGSHVLALSNLSLSAARGELVCLVGASGCGKSSLLSLLAGLAKPNAGTIGVRGRVALLFQEAALFPWLTAGQNIELALRLAGVPRAEWRARVDELLAVVQLDGWGEKRPHELSGGMRQRTAVARALAQGADILLMDEPFGSLDAMTRNVLHDELERLWTERGFTVLFVTHDVHEAVRLGDRVVVLTSRPGQVAHERVVDLPRPRRPGDPRAAALTAEITALLREEVRRHADD
jgi:NitT/TauT family transport system ATP-binding protein